MVQPYIRVIHKGLLNIRGYIRVFIRVSDQLTVKENHWVVMLCLIQESYT